jgi:hypothetical protein
MTVFTENQDEIDRVVLGIDSCWNKSKERPIEIATKHMGLSGDDQALILNTTSKCLKGI